MLLRLIENTKLLSRKMQPMKFGDLIICRPPVLAIVFPDPNFSTDIRIKCLESFSKVAYKCRLSSAKKYTHVNYWYDGPIGNQGVKLWVDGAFQRAQYGVIGISRLLLADSEETLKIAKQAVDLLLQNNNMVLLFPENNEELNLYKTLFPTAMQCLWNNELIMETIVQKKEN